MKPSVSIACSLVVYRLIINSFDGLLGFGSSDWLERKLESPITPKARPWKVRAEWVDSTVYLTFLRKNIRYTAVSSISARHFHGLAFVVIGDYNLRSSQAGEQEPTKLWNELIIRRSTTSEHAIDTGGFISAGSSILRSSVRCARWKHFFYRFN